MNEIGDEYIAVRTSSDWANLIHASLSDSQRDDGSYRPLCAVNKPRAMFADDKLPNRFNLTKPGFRCGKCVEYITHPMTHEERELERFQHRRSGKHLSRTSGYERQRGRYPLVKLHEVFDLPAFVQDVEMFRIRERWVYAELAERAGLTPEVVRTLVISTEPALRTIVTLAETCDLPLDKYRRTRT